MFRGSNSATLDGKGRMALPTRTRETLSGLSENKVVVTIDMREPCLLLYPLSDWEVVQGKLESLSNINPQARLLQRLLIGHATDLQLDGAGRLPYGLDPIALSHTVVMATALPCGYRLPDCWRNPLRRLISFRLRLQGLPTTTQKV